MTELANGWLRGSFTPVVTPFQDGRVDYETFEALVERQVEGGSHGIVVTGTTGEPSSLTAAERGELYRRAVAAAGGRLPVVAATGSPNHAETLSLTADAVHAGVDALLVVAPAFVRPSQDGLYRHFAAVAASTDLPMLLYNIPGRAAVAIAPATVERVVESAQNVVGVKSALTDLDFVTEVLQRLGPDFRVFCGVESLSYPMLAIGAAGLMSAVGNLFPERVAQLCDAVADDDHRTAAAIHHELFAVNRAVFFDTNPVPLKAMLSSRGICSDEVRPPLVPASEEVRSRLAEVLALYQPVDG